MIHELRRVSEMKRLAEVLLVRSGERAQRLLPLLPAECAPPRHE